VESERPSDLNALELEQYELGIEEQAYPFEEKTIKIHEKNLELLSLGIYSKWIEKSFEKLAKLIPARYAKFEQSSGFIYTINKNNYAELTNPAPIIVNVVPAPAPLAVPESTQPVAAILPVTVPEAVQPEKSASQSGQEKQLEVVKNSPKIKKAVKDKKIKPVTQQK